MKHKFRGPRCPVGFYCLYRKTDRVLVLSIKLLRKGEFYVKVQYKDGKIVSVASKYLRPIR